MHASTMIRALCLATVLLSGYGMVTFYKTDAGKAVVEKMPLVTENTGEAMQGLLAQLLPKLQKLQEETLSKLNATK
jgi:hypothetical protein